MWLISDVLMALRLRFCIKLQFPTKTSEFFMIRGTIKVDTKICKGCELCIIACPQDVLALSANFNEKGYRYVELISSACTGCINCALVCPEAAITVYREPKPVKKAQAKV